MSAQGPATLPGMSLGPLFPEGCAWKLALVDGPAGDPVPGLPAEVQASVPRRQREFCAGRACAAAALAELGQPVIGLLGIGADRAPLWPDGFCGSISHEGGIAAAVAASTRRIQAIGLDLAQILTHEQAADIIEVVATRSELDQLAESGIPPRLALSLLFSAREALFKCLAPQVRRHFDFLDVALHRIFPQQLVFRLLLDLAPEHPSGKVFHVRYQVDGGMVHCGIALMSSA